MADLTPTQVAELERIDPDMTRALIVGVLVGLFLAQLYRSLFPAPARLVALGRAETPPRQCNIAFDDESEAKTRCTLPLDHSGVHQCWAESGSIHHMWRGGYPVALEVSNV